MSKARDLSAFVSIPADAGSSVKLKEGSDNGSNFVELKAPASLAGDVSFVLPDADGTNGQVLSTNGSGTLSWASGGGGGSSISAGDSSVEVTDTGSDGKIAGTADNTVVFSIEKDKSLALQGATSQTGAGITFPNTWPTHASTNANTLDDYEEGTWTPTIAQGGTPTSYSTQLGRYTKIGNIVYVELSLNANGATGDGNPLELGGLPFTVNSVSPNGAAIKAYSEFNSNAGDTYGFAINTTRIRIYTSAGSTRQGNEAGISLNENLVLSGWYTV